MPLILLALEGVEEKEHDLFSMIFASQGLKLPPLRRPELTGQRASAEQIKGWAKAVNARMAARKRTKSAASSPRPKRRPPKSGR